MAFPETFKKVMGKYRRMFEKSEHKFLKNVYLGKAKAITCEDEEAEKLLNFMYLKQYGKMKKATMQKLMYGK